MKRITPAVVAVFLLTLLVVVTQYHAFSPSVDDIDEATFMVVAQSVLRGALPYELALDNKPPGLFYLLAAVMGIFGQSLATVRLFGDFTILTAAVALMVLGRKYVSWPVATALAALFVVAHLGRLGDTTKSESIANAFVAISLLVLVSRPRENAASFVAGLLVSCAVLTRTNLAYLALALALLHAAAVFRPDLLGLKRTSIIALALGGAIPLAAVVLPYAMRGELLVLWGGSVEIALSQSRGSAELLQQLLAVPRGFYNLRLTQAVGLVIVFLIGAWKLRGSLRRRPEWQRDAWLGWLYFVSIAVSIAMSGTFFDHYMLQLFVPMTFLAAIGFGTQQWSWRSISAYLMGAGVAAGVLWAVPRGWEFMRAEAGGKPVEIAAVAIRRDMQPDDVVWALRGTHLVLFYLNKDPILPAAAFPTNLTRPLIAGPLARLGLMPEDGAHAAFALRPRYIVARDRQPPEQLGREDLELFFSEYELWQEVSGIVIYRRRLADGNETSDAAARLL